MAVRQAVTGCLVVLVLGAQVCFSAPAAAKKLNNFCDEAEGHDGGRPSVIVACREGTGDRYRALLMCQSLQTGATYWRAGNWTWSTVGSSSTAHCDTADDRYVGADAEIDWGQ
ncbi:hypothetical protein RM844_14390 [Streptomyces sp. DSM 44915]|uniref:Secreted protein n=1 Tax=Streptomyces chisholmiae TaxID=3075540 RepID=A0ABU2JR91_9ACTN|nr:hypothetical protein [Streptomyces sp. DSM 44915]MDT0267477.1 hypothetical protein [Streptomyces sp. DSM 44915]